MSEPKSNANKALEKLADQLSCSICLQEYTQPRVLSCLHIFCEGCLKRLPAPQAGRGTVCCPNCRQVSPIPAGDVANLPSAFYIQHLFEVRDTLEKVRDPKRVQCMKCEEGEAVRYCRDCGQFICEACLTVHRKWKDFENHVTLSLDEVAVAASAMKSSKKVVMLCPKHPTEPMKIYCETCNELICRDCTVRTHREHNYDLVAECFPKHREAIVASLQPIKKLAAGEAEVIQQLNGRSLELDKQGREGKAEINRQIDRLHGILDARRRELLDQVDQKVRQASKQISAERDHHELSLAQLSSCVEFVEGNLQSGTQEEVLSLKTQVTERARHMASNLDSKQLQLDREQVLSVACDDLSSTCSGLGEVELRQQQCQGTHGKTIGGVERPRHIAFANTGEIVVCEQNANCVSIFDSSYKHIRSFGNTGLEEGKLKQPLGVAVSADNTVFVSSPDCVKKFTLEGQFIASVGSKGSGRLQFQSPCAIAYNGTNNKVYVCDTVNHRITILNTDLTFHGSFGCKGSDPGKFDRPLSITVDLKGNVLVIDYYNNRIQVFDASGHFLSAITHTTPEQRLQKPSSVSVGPDSCLYVVELDLHRVSIFDAGGKYIRSLGKKGDKDGEFNSPHCVAVDGEGYVHVSDTRNNRIQMFK